MTSLNIDDTVGLTIIGGFGSNPIPGNTQATIKFTANCNGTPCLSMKSNQAVTFRNIGLSFPNATAGPSGR